MTRSYGTIWPQERGIGSNSVSASCSRYAVGLSRARVFMAVAAKLPKPPRGFLIRRRARAQRRCRRLSRTCDAADDGRSAAFQRRFPLFPREAHSGTFWPSTRPTCEWAGMSLHDTIQPGFTFLAGVALPYSIASRRQRKGESFKHMLAAHHLAQRAAGRARHLSALRGRPDHLFHV